MKRAFIPAALALALLLCLGAALAAGGDAGDPLLSLSYLTEQFSKTADAAVEARLDAADSSLRESLERPAAPLSSSGEELLLNEGDALSGGTGAAVIPLAGDLRLRLDAGALVDATDGIEIPDRAQLSPRHRYIAAEGTRFTLTAESPTAVLHLQGSAALLRSEDSPDYHAIASALRELGLFRGTGSSVAGGFDLHLAPTRGEGLVMFIRLLGEEEAALNCPYSHPFRDVPGWLDRYAAWAWEKGYTNGAAPGLFAPESPIAAQEYVEFLLRAMGYSQAGTDDYTTSLARGEACGALSPGERALLERAAFRRAHVAYLSYYCLGTPLSGGQTLAQRLEAGGLFTQAELEMAGALINSGRL